MQLGGRPELLFISFPFKSGSFSCRNGALKASDQSFLCELYEVTKEHVDAGLRLVFSSISSSIFISFHRFHAIFLQRDAAEDYSKAHYQELISSLAANQDLDSCEQVLRDMALPPGT